jgi:hypothetical protein
MDDIPVSRVFHWYDEHTLEACPPRSLFLILLVMMAVLALPAAGLWARDLYPVLAFLGFGIMGLVVTLAFDVFNTYRRYQTWSGQWLCGECRQVFNPVLARTDILPLS